MTNIYLINNWNKSDWPVSYVVNHHDLDFVYFISPKSLLFTASFKTLITLVSTLTSVFVLEFVPNFKRIPNS